MINHTAPIKETKTNNEVGSLKENHRSLFFMRELWGRSEQIRNLAQDINTHVQKIHPVLSRRHLLAFADCWLDQNSIPTIV